MYKISLITGDGIGPELSESAVSVLNTIHDKLDLKFDITKLSAGDKALSETGKALPDETVESIKQSDVCLKAPVGESAADVIVVLRRMLDLYANIPAKSYPHMPALRDDIDMVIVRENTEDLYTGKEFSLGDSSVALRIISEAASKRIAKYAFETAKQRDSMKKVTCVHKSNVMRITDGMFAKACTEVSKDYPDIAFEQMYVDACAMNLIRQPEQFDVVVTTNLFGDILSDESSQVVGGLGMAPAANIGDKFALFEPGKILQTLLHSYFQLR
jgi:3-isopropylmalate dehydrogenase